MPTFDVVSKTDMTEVDNALNGIQRETQQRFDLKGTKCAIERSDSTLTITADDDLKLKQMHELLLTYFARRDVDSNALDFKPPEDATQGSLRQVVEIKQGIERDIASKITKGIKGSKMKVQVSVQGDELRINGKKRDDLQEAIQFIKDLGIHQPLQYVNFRD
jgi:cyclic-di-GMP-binding protein